MRWIGFTDSYTCVKVKTMDAIVKNAVKKFQIYFFIFLNNQFNLTYNTYFCDFHLLIFTILLRTYWDHKQIDVKFSGRIFIFQTQNSTLTRCL